MNIIFMGTPEFSVPSLKAIAKMPEHKIVGVFTNPDQPAGRSLKLTPPPVKVCALELGLKVYQPEKLNTEENLALFQELKADLLVVVAYGKIIGDKIIKMFPDKILNVHPSLLPKYRGVAPYQWALINGETETGVTIMHIVKELDSGDIILQEKCKIEPNENASSLHDRLSIMGADLLVNALELTAQKKAPKTPQNHNEATYYKKIEKQMGEIDWTKSAGDINNLIRGLNPWPSTFTCHNNNLIKIFESQFIKPDKQFETAAPGTIIRADEKLGLIVKCGTDALSLKKLQLAGKNAQTFDTFLRGYQIKAGDNFHNKTN